MNYSFLPRALWSRWFRGGAALLLGAQSCFSRTLSGTPGITTASCLSLILSVSPCCISSQCFLPQAPQTPTSAPVIFGGVLLPQQLVRILLFNQGINPGPQQGMYKHPSHWTAKGSPSQHCLLYSTLLASWENCLKFLTPKKIPAYPTPIYITTLFSPQGRREYFSPHVMVRFP